MYTKEAIDYMTFTIVVILDGALCSLIHVFLQRFHAHLPNYQVWQPTSLSSVGTLNFIYTGSSGLLNPQKKMP